MSVGSHLFAIMAANAGVQAFVGAGIAARIYDGAIPQNAVVPAYVFNLIAGSPENVMDGAAAEDHELLQIDSWAMDADTANAMREAARAAFEDQSVLIAHGIGAKCRDFYPNEYEPATKRFARRIGISFWTSR